MTQTPSKSPFPPHVLPGALALVALLALAELVWRVAAHQWDAVNRIGVELVRQMHPEMLQTELVRAENPDLARAAEMADIASSYSHALWLLAAFVLAWAVVRLVKATLKPDLWVPSVLVAFLPVALVGGTVLAYVLSVERGGPTPEERAIQAENEQANGTGPHSYDRVLTLLSTCHDSLRKRLKDKEVVIIDDGLVPAVSYVFAYELQGLRFVRIAKSERDVTAASIGAPIRALMPPIKGGYIVAGMVIYSGDDPKVAGRDYREYSCSMLVTDDKYKVVDLRINIIR